MTKKPWRTKAEPSKVKIVVVTGPGDFVSVDQLDSSTPGFVAQLKGILNKRRYTCATVFVDHFSRLGYVHIQQQLTPDETVEAKHAFEAFTRSQDHKVLQSSIIMQIMGDLLIMHSSRTFEKQGQVNQLLTVG
jgi:hypothetical protein